MSGCTFSCKAPGLVSAQMVESGGSGGSGGSGYYCGTVPLRVDGTCAGECLECKCTDQNQCKVSTAFPEAAQKCPHGEVYAADVCATFWKGSNIARLDIIEMRKPAGHYWAPCADGVGIAIRPCDASILPQVHPKLRPLGTP